MAEDIRIQKLENRLDRLERGQWYVQKILDELGNGSTGELLIPDATSLFKFKWNGGGLSYGGIARIGNAVETAIAIAGTPVQITIFDTDQCSNGVTPDHTNNHVTINIGGCYFITSSITVESVVGAGSTLNIRIFKNNGAVELGELHAHRDISGGGNDTASMSISGFTSDLSTNDTVEAWVTNETNTQNYIIKDITLNLILVGS